MEHAQLQRKTIVLLSVAQILSGLGAGAVVSTGSLLAVEMSGSDAWAGSITTASTIGGAIASTLLARLAFARGRRVALSIGLLVAACGSGGVILAAIMGWFPLLLLSGSLIGFGSAVNLQARFAATDLAAAGRRGRDLSLVVWMSTVGAVAGPNLVGAGEAVAVSIGIPTLSGLFVFSAAGMLASMSVIWVGLRPDPYLLSVNRSSSGPAQSTRFLKGIRLLWTFRSARAALIAILVAHGVMVAIMSMTPIHMKGHGASLVLVGLTISLHIAGMYALSPVMGILTDKLGPRPVILGGLVIVLVAAVIEVSSGYSVVLATTGLILLGLGWSAATVAGSTLITNAVPGEVRVATQGAADSLMGLAGGSGGALAGVALAYIGYTGLNVVSCGLVVGALVVVAWIAYPRKA